MKTNKISLGKHDYFFQSNPNPVFLFQVTESHLAQKKKAV